jgi:hypothetical protein
VAASVLSGRTTRAEFESNVPDMPSCVRSALKSTFSTIVLFTAAAAGIRDTYHLSTGRALVS